MLRGVIGRFWTCLAGLAGLLCLGASPAPGNVALEYEAPPGCPIEARFRERVEDLYGFQDPFVPADTAGSFLLRVTIEQVGTTYLAKTLVLNPDGTIRTRFTDFHENCDALVYDVTHDVRVLILPASLSTSPSGTGRDPEAEKMLSRRLDQLEEITEALEAKSKAQDEQIAKLKRDLEEERKKRMNPIYTLATGALMTINLTSNVGPGVWVSGGLWSGPLGLGVDFRAVLPSRLVVGPYDRDLSQLVGLLTPCGRYSIFFGCAVAGAGVQINADTDIELAPGQSHTGFQPLVQLGGRVGVEVPLGESRFAIRGWGEVLYGTPRTHFSYSDGTTASRPDVSGFIGLGFVVKLGDEQEGAK